MIWTTDLLNDRSGPCLPGAILEAHVNRAGVVKGIPAILFLVRHCDCYALERRRCSRGADLIQANLAGGALVTITGLAEGPNRYTVSRGLKISKSG
jgi:hypothetical protein